MILFVVFLFIDLELASIIFFSGQGCGKLGKKPDSESAERGFEILQLTR